MPAPLYDFVRFPVDKFFEVTAGLINASSLAEEAHVATLFDLRCLQGAAPGLRWEAPPPGSEVELRNIHPHHASWRFRLNARVPQMFVRVAANNPVVLSPVIKTIVVEPDKDRVALVWVGEAPLDIPMDPANLDKLQHAVVWS